MDLDDQLKREARTMNMIDVIPPNAAAVELRSTAIKLRAMADKLDAEADALAGPFVDKKITDIGLSERAKNALVKNSIFCVSDLLSLSDEWLLRTEGIGHITSREIREVLAKMGLHFRSYQQPER
jgi:DNA-directed RNA polymerase alpha subunit